MKTGNNLFELDGIDKKILRHLMEDARKPILEIARKIGISGAAIHQRLRKLEASKVISGSKFIINPKVLGLIMNLEPEITLEASSFRNLW